MKRTLLFIFLLSICFKNAKTQVSNSGVINTRFTSRHFTIADGLPQIQITRLFNDSKGFVWVGTKFGLARWDGKKFKVFTPKEGTAGKQVTAITELPNGTIVVGWISGAINWIVGEHMESVALPDRWNIASTSFLSPIGDNAVLVGINSFRDDPGVYKSVVGYLNLNTRKFEKEIWYKDNWIGMISDKGYLLAGTTNSANIPPVLRSYHLDTLVGFHDPDKALGYINANGSTKSVYFTANNSEIFRYSVSDKTGSIISTKLNFKPSKITGHYTFSEYVNGSNIYYDGKGGLWVTDNNSEMKIANIPSCNTMITDNDGNIWVGTENGLYCFFNLGIQEVTFNSKGGTVDEVWSMAKAKDGTYYYASFSKGFWQSKDNNKSWSQIPAIEKLKVDPLMRKGSYGSCGLSNGAVILTTSSGFYYLNNDKATAFDLYGKGAEVYSVLEDKSGNYAYINKWTYLFRLDLKTLKLDTVLTNYNLIGKAVMNLVQDGEGNPIITGWVEPHIFKNEKWKPFRVAPSVFGYSSCMDAKGNLWVGDTQKLTLVKEDSSFSLKYFPGRQETMSMMTWGDKWLIIGGGVDLVFFDLETFYATGKENYQRIDVGSGFTATEGGQNSFLMDSDSSVWWCCNDRILHFWPQKLLTIATQVNSPSIFSIKSIGDTGAAYSVFDSTFFDVKKLPLGYRRLEYSFGAAAMSNFDNLQFRYRLLGKDSSWIYNEGGKEAVFDKLPPGNYRFQVQSSLDGFNWGNLVSAPLLIIPTLWYEEWWFFLIVGVLSICLIALFSYRLFAWKKNKIERQKQLNELQLKAIRSKALPHFTGNSFANIDFYIEKGDTENASRYLAILSRLHNITLADSDKPSRSIEEEIDYVKLYLQMEKLRFEHRLEYIIEVDPSIDQEQQVPNMVLHTYAENALKHGLKHKEGNGLIIVKAVNQSGGVMLSVTDNGIGREAAARMKSFGTQQGLSILGKQIELYNQQNKEKMVQEVVDMLDEEGSVVGTRFAIFIPSNFKY